MSENPENFLWYELGQSFELKEESIGPLRIHLGGHIRKVQLETGVECWSFSSSQCVQAAVKNVKEYHDKIHKAGYTTLWLLRKVEPPMTTSYRPELDLTPDISDTHASYYQSLIDILRWTFELGRVDICLEVSMVSLYLALT